MHKMKRNVTGHLKEKKHSELPKEGGWRVHGLHMAADERCDNLPADRVFGIKTYRWTTCRPCNHTNWMWESTNLPAVPAHGDSSSSAGNKDNDEGIVCFSLERTIEVY